MNCVTFLFFKMTPNGRWCGPDGRSTLAQLLSPQWGKAGMGVITQKNPK